MNMKAGQQTTLKTSAQQQHHITTMKAFVQNKTKVMEKQITTTAKHKITGTAYTMYVLSINKHD